LDVIFISEIDGKKLLRLCVFPASINFFF